MQQFNAVATRGILASNTILRKTFLLLGASLLFSGLTAFWAMTSGAPPLNVFLTIIIYMALLFITSALRQSPLGIVAVFAFTGFLGYTLGPILNLYLHLYVNGGQLIMTSLGATGLIFFALAAYAMITKKDFSYLGGFLFVAIIGAFILGIANIFLHMPLLNFIVSAAFILLSSGIILMQTSQIVQGRETSYIMATINIYVALFNIFVNLLNILGLFSGRNN